MSLNLRRVVTGHDPNGRAVVKIDEVTKNLLSSRPEATAQLKRLAFKTAVTVAENFRR